MTKNQPPTPPKSNLKSGLLLWANIHNITPAKFAKQMNYAYPTAWELLRGQRDVTSDALGRFALKYGIDMTAELLKLAELPEGVESLEILPGDKDTQPVFVVNLKSAN